MRDKTYTRVLRRDIIVAVLIKIFLISLLIFGYKYFKGEKKELSDEGRYPIFNNIEQPNTLNN